MYGTGTRLSSGWAMTEPISVLINLCSTPVPNSIQLSSDLYLQLSSDSYFKLYIIIIKDSVEIEIKNIYSQLCLICCLKIECCLHFDTCLDRIIARYCKIVHDQVFGMWRRLRLRLTMNTPFGNVRIQCHFQILTFNAIQLLYIYIKL